MDKKLAHLEMIQGVVNRLANCSFLLKGWSVLLVSALFARGLRAPGFQLRDYLSAEEQDDGGDFQR